MRRWARREDIHALRLYDRDIPEVPLAVDRYGDGDEAALHISLYERPYDKDPSEEVRWLGAMADAASERLGIDPSRIFLKTRRKMKGLDQYGRTGAEGAEMVVLESGLKFLVNLSDYLDTGLFLDHRPARSLVKSWSAGKRVLNLFCYTGSFSVYAASGGAPRVTSVDLSNTYLAWAERNFRQNGFDPAAYEFVRSDVTAFLSEARHLGRKWDLIIADPPTFSNSSMASADFDVNRDWPQLIKACESVLAAEGVVLFSSNSRRLKWKPEEIASPAKEITESTIPPDFRDRRVHRTWLIGTPPPI
ncbi:MAG: class I SAM-dependent methyltransferase [Rectinemataceae bacterium]